MQNLRLINAKELYEDIPERTKQFLWIAQRDKIEYKSRSNVHKGKEYRITSEYTYNLEPSMIDLDSDVVSCMESRPLDYYPRYESLDSCQKYMFLNWLKNVTQKIELGYLYLYYYALERRLLTNKFENVILEIDRLRKHHHDSNFLYYSTQSIIATCLKNNRLDLISKLETKLNFSLMFIYAKFELFKKLDSTDIINLAKYVGFRTEKYIKDYPNLFKSKLKEILKHKYSEEYLEIGNDIITDSNVTEVYFLLNISLEEQFKKIKVIDIINNKKLKKLILNLLSDTHENVKITLRDMRKNDTLPEKSIRDKKIETNPRAFKFGEIDALSEIKNASDVISLHIAYVKAFEFYYKFRELDDCLIKAERYALYDIEHIEMNYLNLKSFYGKIPHFQAFNRLVIIYEKSNRLLSALEVCQKATKYVNTSEKEIFYKKIIKLRKKLPKLEIERKLPSKISI